MIDIVYLWCDGNDPAFRQAKQARLKELQLPLQDDDIGDLRFADNDELKYSLRSIYQNAPWVNHIYVVTNNQRPKWLKDHPKLTIVDHRDIIPPPVAPNI